MSKMPCSVAWRCFLGSTSPCLMGIAVGNAVLETTQLNEWCVFRREQTAVTTF